MTILAVDRNKGGVTMEIKNRHNTKVPPKKVRPDINFDRHTSKISTAIDLLVIRA